MSFIAGSALVGAESILALTPIAIKKTPLDPISAIWSRVLVSGGLGYLLAGDRGLATADLPSATALGHANLLHIASSYESFRNLPAGQAMSILYTYPLWNLVFGSLFLGEDIRGSEYIVILGALAGSILLNQDPGMPAEGALGLRPRPKWGIFMGIVMALTESAMHTILKDLNWMDPAKSVWVVNGGAAVWLAVATAANWALDGGTKGLETDATWLDAVWLSLFHGLSMFSGYWLRFFAVPRLSTVAYSMLSYAGLLASYLFGLVFLGERPGWMSVVGALFILGSGASLTLMKSHEK
jgi:drug/metabolite transporter (DMT)-like permease